MDNKLNRKRGVKASRAKLDTAMLNAGYKTQGSLAEKIADLENLPAAPKDMVNRAFREQAVESKSLERIARALNVEAFTLYLSSEDSPIHSHTNVLAEQAGTKQAELIHSRSKYFYIVLSIVTALGLSIFIGFASSEREVQTLDKVNEHTLPTKPMNELKVAILGNNHPSGMILKNTMQDAFRGDVRLIEHWSNGQVATMDSLDIPKALSADFVIQWSTESYERYTKLVIHLIDSEQRRILYADAILSVSLDYMSSEVANNVKAVFNQLILGSKTELLPGRTNNLEALQQFVLGMQYLSQENTDVNQQRALERLERALRLDPNFGRAKGGKCEALLRRASLTGDTALKSEAQSFCNVTLASGEFEESLYAIANMYRGQRKFAEAIAMADRLLAVNPRYTEGLFSKIKTYEVWAQIERKPEYFITALKVVDDAIAIEPETWRVYFLQSRLFYLSGDPDSAINSLEMSKQKQANFNNLNNLGTIYFCKGELSKSLANYLAILDLDKDPSWVLEHQLASLYQFLGDTDKAVIYAERGMKRLGTDEVDGHFDPWITKAEAYRDAGNEQVAQESFAKALEIAERFRINNVDTGNSYAQLIYIKIAMAIGRVKGIVEPELSQLREQLENAASQASNPNALIRIMLGWAMLGEDKKAKAIYNKMAAICPGFTKHPGVQHLESL